MMKYASLLKPVSYLQPTHREKNIFFLFLGFEIENIGAGGGIEYGKHEGKSVCGGGGHS